MNTKNLTVLLAGLLLADVGFSQTSRVSTPANAKPAPPTKVISLEGITEYKLENGLRVLLFPDQTKQTATVNITYMVGSKHENYGETGMAHLLEHLVFKGTPKHPNIPAELTSHGARPNGTTWLDRTNYFETFNATDENLEWALDLEADRMVNSFIAKKDLESEFSVVRNEMESGENDPSGVLSERIMSTAFLWHNYGKSTIGARSDVENVPIDRLQAFYRKYYQPDNAILTVSGKFDPAKTLEIINQKFGTIPKPTRSLQETYTEEPTQDGERMVTLRRVGDVQVVGTLYRIPPATHPDFPAIEILQGLLTDEPAGRLYKQLIETKKASSMYGWNFPLKEPGISYFSATVLKDKSLEEVQTILQNVVEDFSSTAPTEAEVERIKNNQIKNIELALNSSERVGLQLSEYIAMGDWRMMFYSRDQLKKVTPADVVRVAKKYFIPSNRTMGVFLPTPEPVRAEIPKAPDLNAMLKDYKGAAEVAQGEAFDATPANIQSRLVSTTAGGVKLNIVPKKTRGEVVVSQLVLRFGDENSLKGRGTAGQFAARMIDKGTKSKTRQDIQDAFDKLKARVSFSGGASSLNVNIETTRQNFPEVLKLVSEILHEAAFPAEELEKLKQESLASIEQNRSEPTSIAVLELQRHFDAYGKDDPRYVETLDESISRINSVKISEVTGFYNDFYGASNAYLAVVGDVDAGETQKLANSLFSSWKSPKPFKRLEAKRKDVSTLNKNIETPDKANAFFYAMQPISISSDDADYPAFILGNYILGGGFLNSRLATRIRQKEGISYGVGSGANADYFDRNSGALMAYAIYAPENVEKLEAAFKEELEKVVKEGFTEAEVAEAKKGYMQSRKVSLAQDNSLAATLNNYAYYGEPVAYWQELQDKLDSLTAKEVNSVMKKYVDPAKISMVKAGDFAKKDKAAGTGK